jgi:hypothetical protein
VAIEHTRTKYERRDGETILSLHFWVALESLCAHIFVCVLFSFFFKKKALLYVVIAYTFSTSPLCLLCPFSSVPDNWREKAQKQKTKQFKKKKKKKKRYHHPRLVLDKQKASVKSSHTSLVYICRKNITNAVNIRMTPPRCLRAGGIFELVLAFLSGKVRDSQRCNEEGTSSEVCEVWRRGTIDLNLWSEHISLTRAFL